MGARQQPAAEPSAAGGRRVSRRSARSADSACERHLLVFSAAETVIGPGLRTLRAEPARAAARLRLPGLRPASCPGTTPADRGRCWPACGAARCPPAATARLRVIPGSHCGDRDLAEKMPSGSRVRRCCRPCARPGPAHRHRPATLGVRE
jgi:hypothetical protein